MASQPLVTTGNLVTSVLPHLRHLFDTSKPPTGISGTSVGWIPKPPLSSKKAARFCSVRACVAEAARAPRERSSV